MSPYGRTWGMRKLRTRGRRAAALEAVVTLELGCRVGLAQVVEPGSLWTPIGA